MRPLHRFPSVSVPSRALALLLAASALAAPLVAQDSVSKLLAVPGDSVSAHDPAEQVNDYVVDLGAVRSSSGATFGVAPLVKASEQRAVAPVYFNGGLSAQAISKDLRVGVPFRRPSYALWNGPGQGVNHDPARNDPGVLVSTAGAVGNRFAVGFAEFGQGTGDVVSLNGLVGAFVDYDPARPSRLYVSRVVAAVNSADDDCDLGQYGFGAIDADGALHFRGDDAQGQSVDCGGGAALIGNNYFRVALGARNPTLVNRIVNGGGSDAAATTALISNSATALNAPNAIPASLAGRPVLLGTSFTTAYLWESLPGTLSSGTAVHLGPGLVDHRGNLGFSPYRFPAHFGASTVGTAALLGVIQIGPTNALNVFGVAADGSSTGVLSLGLPSPLTTPNVVVDNDDGWRSDTLGLGFVQFDHYHSQVAFRGGSGQVAIGQDRAGRLLAAATAQHPNSGAGIADENNLIAVARVEPDGAVAWTIAAYTVRTTTDAGGKAIFDGAGNAIGRLVPFSVLAGNAFPSMSAPMFDALGNVWLLASIELFGRPSEVTVGLLRGLYDADAFSFRLELVLAEGDVLHGRNSGTDYKIDFLEVPDSNSISSGTAFSNNISPLAHLGQDPARLDQRDARTLGGLVLKASIVYDTDGDGQFVRSTGSSGTPGSPDEDYQVLLYVGATGDCNENGVPDDAEIAEGDVPDLDHDGVPDDCQPVLAFCAGDGSSLACPCGNVGAAGHGCGNAGDPSGGRLEALGDLAQGNVLMQASGLPPIHRPTALLVRSSASMAAAPFGDGIHCLNAPVPLGADFALNGTVAIPVQHQDGPGTFHYQLWYRNAGLFCDPFAAFNATNALRVVWP